MIVVIPALNPDFHLTNLIKELKEKTKYKIIVINDGSETSDVFNQLDKSVTVLTHKVNKGKGAALKTALKYIKKTYPKEDGVVFADADGQHAVHDIIKISDHLLENKNALVTGRRKFANKVPIKSRIGNGVTRFMFMVTSGKYMYDTQTGLRAISLDNIDVLLEASGDRYEYEMNMLYGAIKNNIKIIEVPIKTIYENNNKASHFKAIRDSILIYKSIFKFMSSSLISAGIDYVLFIILYPFIGILSANIGARIVSAIVNYTINKKFVFKSKDDPLKSLSMYFLLALFIIVLNSAVLYLFTSIITIKPAIAKVIVEVLMFMVSYTVQKKVIFRGQK